MMWLLLLLLIVTLFLSLIVRLLKVHVAIFYRINLGDTHRLIVKLSILRIPCWKRTIQLPTLQNFLEKESASSRNIPWKEFSPFLKKIQMKTLNWETGVGTGEADLTGIIAGMIWTGKEVIIQLLEAEMNMLSSPEFMVKPNYHGEGFYSRFDGELKIPFHTLIKLRKILNRYKKN